MRYILFTILATCGFFTLELRAANYFSVPAEIQFRESLKTVPIRKSGAELSARPEIAPDSPVEKRNKAMMKTVPLHTTYKMFADEFYESQIPTYRAQAKGSSDGWTRPKPPIGSVDKRRIDVSLVSDTVTEPTTAAENHGPAGAGGGVSPQPQPSATQGDANIVVLTELINAKFKSFEEKLNNDEKNKAATVPVTAETTNKPSVSKLRENGWTTLALFVIAIGASAAFLFAFFTAIDYRRRWLFSMTSQNSRLATNFDGGGEYMIDGGGSYLTEQRFTPLDFRY